MDTFWTWFGRIDSILGVLTVFFAGYTYVRIRQLVGKAAKQPHRLESFQQLIEANRGIKSLKPVALAISPTPTIGSIGGAVKNFIQANGWNMPVQEIDLNGLNGPEDFARYFNLLCEKKRLIEASGHTQLHLFLSAPMPACVLAGALFDNWIPVKLYHKTSEPAPKNYEYWMPLVKQPVGSALKVLNA